MTFQMIIMHIIQFQRCNNINNIIYRITQSNRLKLLRLIRHTVYCAVLLTCSCTNNRQVDSSPQELFPQPSKVQANPQNGYLINHVSGDSILPIILSNGDTLQTGKPIPVKWKVIHPDSVSKPLLTKASQLQNLTNVIAHQNIFDVPKKTNRLQISFDTLTKITIKNVSVNSDSNFHINSKGDTIRTGVLVPVKGKIVNLIRPNITPALLPRFKDNSILNMQYLDVDQGMISSYIYSILEDNKGHLWFGTSAGLSMYDGKSFVHFTEKEGLSNNAITSIVQDRRGNLWFGTYGGGISMYNGQYFTHFTEKEGMTNDLVWSIIEDTKGNLWFATGGGGVSRFDGKNFKHFTKNEGLSSNSVHSILEDRKGNLWFGTNGGGVSMYNGKSFIHFTQKNYLTNNPIYSIVEDIKGNIWFCTNGSGICMYNGQYLLQLTEKDGLSHNVVLSMLEDRSGNLWLGTAGRGVIKYNGSTFENITVKEGLSNNVISEIIQDKLGNIWFGTNGGGISMYKEKSFVHLDRERGLSNNSVRSIIEDKDRNVWFGTNGGGVTKYDGINFTHYYEKDGISYHLIWSMLQDKKGNIWFGKNGGGVSKFDGTYFTHYKMEEGLSDGHIVSILEDSRGDMWFGTLGGGVSVFDGIHFKHLTEKEGLPHNDVVKLLEDKKGNIWLATYGGGVTKYDGKYLTHYTEKEGLSDNAVNSIFEDKFGRIWFGTDKGGVNIYDGTSFIHYTEKEGLCDNSVRSIQSDNKDRIWVSTENGITYFQLDKILTTKISFDKTSYYEYHLNNISRNDGLKGMDFYHNSNCLDSKNRFWWGSGKGLTMIDLNSFRPASNPPVVDLQQVDINELFIDFRHIENETSKDITFSSVESFMNYPLDLKVPFNKNHLTFHFSAIDWSAPHKIKYSYIMEGLSTAWSKPSPEAKIDYRNIPYGTYTLKVKAIGESGVWSKPFEYSFTILPPWWQTWWSRSIYVSFAILSIWVIIRWRTMSLKQRQKELQNEIDSATKEIRKQKEDIEHEKERSDNLLLNILPEKVAEELKSKGNSDAQLVDQVTVLFTDFKDFSSLSEKISPNVLVSDLHNCFSAFDEICEKYNIEKIKTIGDAYMAAGGLPSPNNTHAHDVVKAAIEMANLIKQSKETKLSAGLPFYEMRIGIHTGPVVAGIVGIRKFQYDIWGDTVNTASRMESSSEPGRINISETTYQLVKDSFLCTYRGKIQAKGKGVINMYFVNSVK